MPRTEGDTARRVSAPSPLRAGCAAVLMLVSGPLTVRAADAPPAASAATEATPRERADAHLRDAAARGGANDWDGAIAAFRKAEALYPRAIHDCNIGLAFMRSARPHLAWIYLGRCQVRATDALPAWVDTMRRDTLTAMRAGTFAPVELTTTPGNATVTVDTLPDETFSPTAGTLSLWLPHGPHAVRIAAPGHVTETRALDLSGRETTRLAVALATEPAAQPVPRPAEPRPERSNIPDASPRGGVEAAAALPQREISTTAWIVVGSGLAVFSGGLVALGFALDTAASPQRDEIPEGPRFDALRSRFKVQNTVWIAMGLSGGILTAAGATMMGFDLWGDAPGATSTGRMSLAPGLGGGTLSVGGTF